MLTSVPSVVLKDELTIVMPSTCDSLPPGCIVYRPNDPVRTLRTVQEFLSEPRETLVRVDAKSPRWIRRLVYLCAFYFRREFSYDFVQYDWDEKDPDHVAYLWLYVEFGSLRESLKKTPLGAVCFRLREEDAGGMALQWVWIHPFRRRQNLLSRAWPFFQDAFGWFDVEFPLSKEMDAFLKKVGWEERP